MTYTLVISSYKYGHLAAHAIESALSQSKRFDKIFFVDDGVGDCRHLPAKYSKIKYIFRKRNLGTVKNFQEMLLLVETDYVMFLGADNWIQDDTLEVLSRSEADIITYDIIITGELKKNWLQGDASCIKAEVKKIEGQIYWDRSIGHHGSMLYKTKIAKQAGGYARGKGKNTDEDEVLYNRMLKIGATREHIPRAFLFYRRHRNNFNPCSFAERGGKFAKLFYKFRRIIKDIKHKKR